MTRFLISFDDGGMAHIPDDDWPAVGEVPTREDALNWAAKIAVACRCTQEVRALMADLQA